MGPVIRGLYDGSLQVRIYRSHQLVRDAYRLLTQTSTLREELQTVVAHSVNLRRQSRYLGPRRIGGGADDPALVTEVLAGGVALCAECIARKTGIPLAEIPSVVARVSRVMRLERPDVACTVCLTTRKVYRLVLEDRSGKTSPTDKTTLILRFLHEHPERVFCVRCISAQLFDGADIDVAMRHIEAGEPVGDDLTAELKIRCRHGHCAQCGKPRLVAGVIVN